MSCSEKACALNIVSVAPRFSEVTFVNRNDLSRFNGFRKKTVETVALSMASRDHLAEAANNEKRVSPSNSRGRGC